MSNIEIMDPASLEELNSSSRCGLLSSSGKVINNNCHDHQIIDGQQRQEITINDPNVPRPALNGIINKGNLYLNLLDIPPGDYSKELFITLLDKAEEAGCNNVIVCLDKQASMRPFAFLGFKLLPPNHPLVPGIDCTRNMLLMGYQLEGEEL